METDDPHFEAMSELVTRAIGVGEKVLAERDALRVQVKELVEALKEAQAWMPHGDGSTPDSRGTKYDTLIGAFDMVGSAIARAEGKEEK